MMISLHNFIVYLYPNELSYLHNMYLQLYISPVYTFNVAQNSLAQDCPVHLVSHVAGQP